MADAGLPELLRVPTGCGKTLAATLPWLYRRRFHPDPHVRRATPHWLVYCLPMRVLVEQTVEVVSNWIANLDLEHRVGVHVVMGGEGRLASRWRLDPEADAVFVGTLDMLLSRALNRGYGESRFAWPIDFGLFHNGCQWVFDEVQLMGPALPTSRQLEGFRRRFGTAIPSASMWMSATIDERALRTVDLPDPGRIVGLSDADRAGALQVRLTASRRILPVRPDPKRYVVEVADTLVDAHRAGTLTLAIVNTVDRARDLARAVASRTEADVVLLHSRFRPPDRHRAVGRALAPVSGDGAGRIVVSTQVVEAGVDISAATLFTEAAPWPSIVQRAGRCNRDGLIEDATFLWAEPPRPEPYHPDDVVAATSMLNELSGRRIDGPTLGAATVPTIRVPQPVLRRRDLLELFDTAPDLSGNDVDVSRFIRSVDDVDCLVAWRDLPDAGPIPDQPSIAGGELCPVPIGELRAVLRRVPRCAWRFDHLASTWLPATADDLRPGQVTLMRSREGRYTPDGGWDPQARVHVPELIAPVDDPSPLTKTDEAVSDDPLTVTGRWVGLAEHLEDVERCARRLMDALDPTGLSTEQRAAAIAAAALHDIGKAHPVFQASMLRLCDEAERPLRERDGPWAKSGRREPLRHERRHFRHELASALVLLGDGSVLLDGIAERDLAVYLVAAHHGRVRMAIRSMPNETPPETPGDGNRRVALGVWDGDTLPALDLPGGRLPECRLELWPMELGATDGRASWTQRALTLRDRADLGVFRLAFLEALVRLADWRASQQAADAGVPQGDVEREAAP
jgi:CRISPR-associated endonuclease/helicase Cas3